MVSRPARPSGSTIHPDEDEMEAAAPQEAVPAALEMLHEDFAYEFELTWELWVQERAGERGSSRSRSCTASSDSMP